MFLADQRKFLQVSLAHFLAIFLDCKTFSQVNPMQG